MFLDLCWPSSDKYMVLACYMSKIVLFVVGWLGAVHPQWNHKCHVV
jgi:hypothetical protein